MENRYLNINTKFNKDTFDEWELFNTIEELLASNKIPVDDFKGNIFAEENMAIGDWDKDEFHVKCNFSWIFYPEDVSKKDFEKIATTIENLLIDKFNIPKYDIECFRYNNSDYTDRGYDVNLQLHIMYKLDK